MHSLLLLTGPVCEPNSDCDKPDMNEECFSCCCNFKNQHYLNLSRDPDLAKQTDPRRSPTQKPVPNQPHSLFEHGLLLNKFSVGRLLVKSIWTMFQWAKNEQFDRMWIQAFTVINFGK